MDNRASSMSFTQFETGIQNIGGRQNFLMRLKSLQIADIDFDQQRVPLMSLSPVTTSETVSRLFALSTEDIFNFCLYFSRHSDEQTTSEMWLRLQDMNIQLKRKPSMDVQERFEMPDIQKIVQQMVAYFDSKREEIFSKIKTIQEKGSSWDLQKGLNQVKFDLRWELEMGDCEVAVMDAESTQSRGVLRISNASQTKNMIDKFVETENRLLNTNIQLAQVMSQGEVERDELRRKIKELEDRVQKVIVDKDISIAQCKKYAEDMEQNFVNTKMKMAQLQMDNDNFQYEVFQLKNHPKQ